jgi:outer membrane lipoprotein-sorting protein
MTLLCRTSVLLISTFLSACPRLPPLDYGKNGPAQNGAELLKRIEVADAQIFAVRGDAKLIVDSPEGKGSVSIFVAVLHPAQLHIEQLDFFGRPENVLISDGDRFGLYDSKQRTYFRGPASVENMSRFVPLALPPRELASLLLGRVPRIPPEETTLSIDEASRLYGLTLKRGSITQRLSVSTGTHRVTKSQFKGVETYSTDADDLTVFGPAVLPRHLTLTAPKAGTKVELLYKDITVNEAPDVTLFEMEPPEGIPVVEVQADGRVVAIP